MGGSRKQCPQWRSASVSERPQPAVRGCRRNFPRAVVRANSSSALSLPRWAATPMAAREPTNESRVRTVQ